jgi:hypothetical protein
MRLRALIVGILTLALGAGGLIYARSQYQSLVMTSRIVTPAQAIPPYTLITPNMLTTREIARSVLNEPIYTAVDDVVGKVSLTPLMPGMLIYQTLTVPQAQARLTDDPNLEVVAFPVSIPAAVGNQLAPGFKVNLYKLTIKDNSSPAPLMVVATPLSSPTLGLSATTALNATSAAGTPAQPSLVEIWATNVPVVAVQTAQGQRIHGGLTAVTTAPQGANTAQGQSGVEPIQIITVAVPHELAAKILEVVAQPQGAELWVTLAPLTAPVASAAGQVQP